MTCKSNYGNCSWILKSRRTALGPTNLEVFGLLGSYQQNEKVRWQPAQAKGLYTVEWNASGFTLVNPHDRRSFTMSDWCPKTKAYKLFHQKTKCTTDDIDGIRAYMAATYGTRGDGDLCGYIRIYDILESSRVLFFFNISWFFV